MCLIDFLAVVGISLGKCRTCLGAGSLVRGYLDRPLCRSFSSPAKSFVWKRYYTLDARPQRKHHLLESARSSLECQLVGSHIPALFDELELPLCSSDRASS